MALRIRDFTVPRGSPVAVAIWRWVRPSKNARASTDLCSSGRERMARPIRARRSSRSTGDGRIELPFRDRALHLFPGVPRARFPRGATAQKVDGAVAGNPSEPGAHERLLAPICVRLLPGAQKDILRDLLGSLLVPHDPQGKTVDEPAMPRIQLAESLGLSAHHAAHELFVSRHLVRHDANIVMRPRRAQGADRDLVEQRVSLETDF